MVRKFPQSLKSIFRTTIAMQSIVLLSVFISCNKKESEPEPKAELKFISEEYKPFNYTENSNPAGLAPDLLKEICNDLNIKFEIKFKEWDEAYNDALNTENAVLFSTTLNSTRKDLFKWAGPIASVDWNFYTASGSPVVINDLDQAKKLQKVGVIKDYATEEYLLEQGFTNLVYCTDVNDALKKLLANEIDAFPSDQFTTKSAMENLGSSIYSVNRQFTIKTELLYFAFNKNIDDKIVADFQNTIDLCKTNGKLKLLSQQYLNTSDYPDIIQIYTESYPPLTFRNSHGEITGFGTDVVKEIMDRNNLYAPIRLSTWSNGYQLALNNPNFCLFTMDKTDIRKDLFQWVGPIGKNTTWIYTLAENNISVNSLASAKTLDNIGVVSSWFSTQYLQEQGFTNLVFDGDPSVLTQKLIKGEIDAFVCTDITFPDILKELGYSYSLVKPSFSMMSSDFFIAFSKNTPSLEVKNWQNSLNEMISDGTYSAIKKKWFPGN